MLKNKDRYPLSSLLATTTTPTPEIDILHLFGSGHILVTLKNQDSYGVYNLSTQNWKEIECLRKRYRLAVSFPYVVSLHGGVGGGLEDMELMVYDVFAEMRHFVCLSGVLGEVFSIFCGDDFILVVANENLYTSNYLELNFKELKLNSTKNLMSGPKSTRTTMKQNHLLLVAKNNKSFQLWNIGTGECIMENAIDEEAFIIISFDSSVVVATTKTKLIIWQAISDVPTSYSHRFISAISISGDNLVTGNIHNDLILYNIPTKKFAQLNTVLKKTEEGDLIQMNSGIFSVQLLGEFVLCGNDKGIEIWNLKLYNQTNPIAKTKAEGAVVQIHISQSNTVYFLIKSDKAYTSVISWNPSQEIFGIEKKQKSTPKRTKETKIKEEKSKKSHNLAPAVKITETEIPTTNNNTESEGKGFFRKLPKFNLPFRSKTPPLEARGRRNSFSSFAPEPHTPDSDEDNSTECLVTITKITRRSSEEPPPKLKLEKTTFKKSRRSSEESPPKLKVEKVSLTKTFSRHTSSKQTSGSGIWEPIVPFSGDEISGDSSEDLTTSGKFIKTRSRIMGLRGEEGRGFESEMDRIEGQESKGKETVLTISKKKTKERKKKEPETEKEQTLDLEPKSI